MFYHDQSFISQPQMIIDTCQRSIYQAPAIRRVKEDEVIAPHSVCDQEGFHPPLMNVTLLTTTEFSDIIDQNGDGFIGELHKVHPLCHAGKRFQTQRSGSGIEIQYQHLLAIL